MFILKKMKTLASMAFEKKILLIEAIIFLAWARILKGMPFSRIAPLMGTFMAETTLKDNPSEREIGRLVSDAIHIMSRYAFWESECLVKAIAGMKMLERRSIESTLYLGTGKDENGKMIAHAWLRNGSFYISGIEGMEKFTVVAKFANQKSNRNRGRSR